MKTQIQFLCEGCCKPIVSLRLVKWQEWDTLEQRVITHRLWLCLTCWLEHGGELQSTGVDMDSTDGTPQSVSIR